MAYSMLINYRGNSQVGKFCEILQFIATYNVRKGINFRVEESWRMPGKAGGCRRKLTDAGRKLLA